MTINVLAGLSGLTLLLAACGLALGYPEMAVAAAADDRRLDRRVRAYRGFRLDLAGVVARIRKAGN